LPNLKHLLDDLEDLGIESDKVKLPRQLYDNIVSDAESAEDEEE
jgi:hypothetical protein